MTTPMRTATVGPLPAPQTMSSIRLAPSLSIGIDDADLTVWRNGNTDFHF